MNLFDLKGKNAFVIGAGGIGTAIAQGLSWQGAYVVVADVSEKNAKNAVAKIEADGGKADYIVADITTKSDIEAMFAEMDKKIDRLDILVNSAGIGSFSSALDMTEDVWNTVLNHFLNSVFWCCQQGGKRMVPNKYGKIINLCSMSGMVATGDVGSSYAAAKAGLIQLTKNLGCEWIPHGVNVNGISPGMVRTALTDPMFDPKMGGDPALIAMYDSQIPLGRMAQPIDMVGPALFLASPASDYLVGQNIVADGGYTCR
ncbi:MAG: SDR family oxidoreductase [bacterium]|nr:SDR family oxidoreductase [bacterium]